MVQYSHVDIGVVEVVRIRRVILFGPVRGQRTVETENVMLGFGLIVDAVEAHHLGKPGNTYKRSNLSPRQWVAVMFWTSCDGATHVLQEEVQLRMTAGVDGDFKQRHEDILQHLLEITQLLLCVVHIAGKVGIES